jgi:hypothetical protein
MDEEIHQPHDKLFTATFSQPENAAGLLRAELPSALAGAIDWDSLRTEPGSFVDSQFRRSHTDLLFSAGLLGRETLLYVLFEHQSARDTRLPLRLLRYMTRIWEELDRTRPHPAKLPPILPVVLSQNAEVWEVANQLAALLDLPPELEKELRPFIPDFCYRDLQLAAMDYAAIPGTSSGVFVLRAMKAERLGALLEAPVWEEDLILRIPEELFRLVLRYILGADIDKAAFESRIQKIQDPQLRTAAMSLAQVYRQEGRQEGRHQGRQEGRRQDILRLLEVRFGTVPQGIREAVLEEGAPSRLDLLFDAAITSADLESFAAGL